MADKQTVVKFKYAGAREVRKLSDADLIALIEREPFPRPKGYSRFSPASMELAARNLDLRTGKRSGDRNAS